MKDDRKTPLIVAGVLSIASFYLANRLASVYEAAEGNVVDRLLAAFSGLGAAIGARPFFISFVKPALLAGCVAICAIWLGYLYYLTTVKNYRYGEEHGSSRWGTPKDIAPLTNPVPDLNIPLSATEQISATVTKTFEADRNKNIVVVGGPGSGKTYSEIKPSLMQLHSSYVITDPKGTILPDTGYLMQRNGYEVISFNTIDFNKSLHYNPLAYIHKEKDILKVVNVLISNTSGGSHAVAGDKFWTDCERLLYTALIAYLWYEAPAEDLNIPTMIEMLELCQVKEDDEDFKSPMDILFEELEATKPDCLAVKQYRKFKQAAGKTLKSILISCAARLAPFDIDELREITSYDELHLDEIGDRKTALYIIMSDTDSTYAFLIAMIMYQMFNLLCEKADNEYGGKLPFQVHCLLDEFANIGKIPEFEWLITTIRSRGISCMIILQSLTQISAAYKDNADTIIDGCDTFVFLGGKSTKTTKQISEMIGKETIDTRNVNESRGASGSWSLQNNTQGRDLIDPAEVGRLKRSECLVLITGLPPFRSRKYNPKNHPRFHEISDGGAPLFDIRNVGPPSMQNEEAVVVESYCVDLSALNSLT